MPENPELIRLLEQIKSIAIRKSDDYAASGPFENFDRSATVMSWFSRDADKAFVCLITTKLARLATLLNSGKIPNNESIADSFLDLTTYCALWSSYYTSQPLQTKQYTTSESALPLDRLDKIAAQGFK